MRRRQDSFTNKRTKLTSGKDKGSTSVPEDLFCLLKGSGINWIHIDWIRIGEWIQCMFFVSYICNACGNDLGSNISSISC